LDAVSSPSHYDTQFHLDLSEPDKKDLVEYLKSL
jgi:hypothetical protein